MKNIILSTILFFGINLFLVQTSKAQELVKPVKTQSVKKAEQQSYPSKSELKYQAETESNHQKNTSAYDASKGTNATKDDPDYQHKKTEWIKKNPEKYKELSGNPNLIILTEAQFNALSPEEKVRAESDPANYLIIR